MKNVVSCKESKEVILQVILERVKPCSQVKSAFAFSSMSRMGSVATSDGVYT